MKDYKDTINLPKTAFAMKADLAKREPAMLAEWEESDRYGEIQRRTADRPHAFILHDGPPYANGAIHLGHSVNKILKDIVVKSKLVAGLRSPYVPGWDCHGLPIEVAIEKKVGKVGVKVDAAEFRTLCREYAAKQIDLQRADFKRLGVLGDWSNPYITMDFKYEADMLRALAKIVANGHLVRGVKPVHWCFDCASALAEAEIEYQDKQSPSIDVRYAVADAGDLAGRFSLATFPPARGQGGQTSLVIWTTTPWTLPASMAVTVHADFKYALLQAPAKDGAMEYLLVAAELAPALLQRYGITGWTEIAQAEGRALEGLQLRHPFYERAIPVLLGEHVTLDAGTGAVHTAPGHGMEDFTVGQKYGLVDKYSPAELNPVGGNGVYLPGTPLFAGQFIWKANDPIVALLKERGALLHEEKITHSYPHCWRHKTPVAFRTTPQWFISMDKAGLRAGALRAIREDVKWFPAWGEERIHGMVAGRPDWCISRQRTWGVPIALFVDRATQQPHPRSVELLETVARRVEKEGVDAWYALDPAELLGADAAEYEKVTDILDVWFDSGVTHFCVLDQRAPLARGPGDKVMYLEGSDQHRGWFHSSLLTSVAMHGRAPYHEVLTHGFTVDAQGRKMSKSLGNGIEPQDVMKNYGADILRLWIASADYRNEMALSDEILKRVADAYRRIRNTARFLLGNLDGFDPAEHLLALEQCLPLDQWAAQQALDVQEAVIAAYARHEFPEVVQRVQNFCTNEMGALYLDVTKDRLYTMKTASPGRRSAQSAMYRILEAMTRWLAPILSFTAEEMSKHIPGRRPESVLFETWYDGLAALQGSMERRAYWDDLRAIRGEIGKSLEQLRQDGAIGASLQAEVDLYLPAEWLERYRSFRDELRFFFITSALNLGADENPPPDATAAAVDSAAGRAQFHFRVRPSGSPKCVRCWHHRPEVGSNALHPQLCARCVDNIDGAGERRQYA